MYSLLPTCESLHFLLPPFYEWTVQGIEAVMAVSGVSSKAKERRKLGSCLKDAALRLLGVSQANGVIRSRDMWRDVLLE